MEMFGITVTDIPDPKHLLLPDGWPVDAYPLFAEAERLGLSLINVHKGFPSLLGPGSAQYVTTRDIAQATLDWPQLNFTIYHSGYFPDGTGISGFPRNQPTASTTSTAPSAISPISAMRRGPTVSRCTGASLMCRIPPLTWIRSPGSPTRRFGLRTRRLCFRTDARTTVVTPNRTEASLRCSIDRRA